MDCKSNRTKVDDFCIMKVPVSVLVIILLALHGAMLAYAATRHSPTTYEPAQIAAGITHWKYGRFDLYNVNPPLIRAFAVAPLLALEDVLTDWRHFTSVATARPEFVVGGDLVAANGARFRHQCMIARWTCIPISLLGGVFCFLWAKELYSSNRSGILALTLWCFEPNILGNAELATNDVGAATFGVGAAYLFWRWLNVPTLVRAMAAGVLLGLAELSKMSWIILYGVWPLLWMISLIKCGVSRNTPRPVVAVSWFHQLLQLGALLILSVYLINAAYLFDGSFQSLGSYLFRSNLLSGQATAGVPGNRFASSWLGEWPVPLPAQYLLGFDLQYVDFEQYNHPSYLRGEWKRGGWWYYYLYGFCVKVPHSIHILFAISVLSLLTTCVAVARMRTSRMLKVNMNLRDAMSLLRENLRSVRQYGWDMAVLLAPAIVLLFVVSSQQTFNHHFRYVLPVFGFAFVYLGQVACHCGSNAHLRNYLTAGCVAWLLVTTFINYPHNLAYFNEAAGGMSRGHEHLLHSSLDAEQDLFYLDEWIKGNPHHGPVVYFANTYWGAESLGVNCTYPASDSDVIDHATRFVEADEWLRSFSGVLAIRAGLLMGQKRHVYLENVGHLMCDESTFQSLRRAKPLARVGASLFLYKFPLSPTSGS